MKKTVKDYCIKVPVFTSERIERDNWVFSMNYQELIDHSKRLITEHNKNDKIISSDKRNKTIKKEIGNIEIHERAFGQIPYLLLKISAYNTNWEGCLITSKETVQIDNKDKIGSDNNYVMLYPQIIGSENQSIFWIILVYDDPKKDSFDNISTAKLVLTKILNQPVKSVKLPAVLRELKEQKILPQIKMNLNAISFDEGNIAPKYEQYCTSAKTLKREEYDFNNMPFDKIEELIRSPLQDYTQRIIKLIVRKKEYKITQDLKKEIQAGQDELVEQIFNMTTNVKEEELDDIYNIEFVISKLQNVLETYLKNGDE